MGAHCSCLGVAAASSIVVKDDAAKNRLAENMQTSGASSAREEESLKREEVNVSEDCISNLPDHILSSIMSYLTVKDAVKTSILSRRWRCLYELMPHLNFDWDAVFHETPRRKDYHCIKYLQKFVRGVNQFLQHYSSPKMISFRISFCFGKDVACDVDRWIAFVVRLGLEKLELCSTCVDDLPFKTFFEYKPHEMYVFSCKLLSEAFELKYLRLQSCILVPDFKCQFNSLTCLYMKFVPLGQSQVQDILSTCVNLEWLLVSHCCLPKKLPICGPRRLKHLIISNCEGLKDIELSAINLTTFEYFGTDIRFSFVSVLKLENVVLAMSHERSIPYIFQELANDLPQLKSLSIAVRTNMVHLIPGNITTFRNVKQLDFCLNLKDAYNLLKIIPILTACPVLQNFCLMLTCVLSEEIRGTEELEDCILPELKEVEIGGFCGTENQMKLASYVLKNAVALERFVVGTGYWFFCPGGKWVHASWLPWEERKRELVREQLQRNAFCKSAVVTVR